MINKKETKGAIVIHVKAVSKLDYISNFNTHQQIYSIFFPRGVPKNPPGQLTSVLRRHPTRHVSNSKKAPYLISRNIQPTNCGSHEYMVT